MATLETIAHNRDESNFAVFPFTDTDLKIYHCFGAQSGPSYLHAPRCGSRYYQ